MSYKNNTAQMPRRKNNINRKKIKFLTNKYLVGQDNQLNACISSR